MLNMVPYIVLLLATTSPSPTSPTAAPPRPSRRMRPRSLAGHQGTKEREPEIPVPDKTRLVEALERVVQLYEASGNKAKANKWQQTLATAKAGAKP